VTKDELREMVLEEVASCLQDGPPGRPTPPSPSTEIDSQIGVEVVSRVGKRINRKLPTTISKSRKNVTSSERLTEVIWRVVSKNGAD
jgi:hypothetical protein